jgi:AAA family ATP:ADP antiporter
MRLSGRFLPMVALFFLMAFVNTILDSLKDTLVITAAGGGAQVCTELTSLSASTPSIHTYLSFFVLSVVLPSGNLFSNIRQHANFTFVQCIDGFVQDVFLVPVTPLT